MVGHIWQCYEFTSVLHSRLGLIVLRGQYAVWGNKSGLYCIQGKFFNPSTVSLAHICILLLLTTRNKGVKAIERHRKDLVVLEMYIIDFSAPRWLNLFVQIYPQFKVSLLKYHFLIKYFTGVGIFKWDNINLSLIINLLFL